MATNKKVMLVTGVSGRIGRAIVHRFGDKFHIVGFDRHKVEHSKDMDHVMMDISSDDSVHQGLEYVKNTYGKELGPVIHLAAFYSFSGGDPSLYETITVQGTHRILKELQGFKVDQFHFASTLLVHGPCKLGETINEDTPLAPEWDYPKSKVRTEKVMHDERGDIPIVVMRIAGCYDDQCHSIPIGHNIQRIYQHELQSHFFPGDVRHGNPFLHMEDLMDAYGLAFDKIGQLPEAFTVIIGEDKTMSYGDMQNKISELLEHRDFRVFRIPKWMAKEGAWVEEHLPFIDDKFVQPWMIDVADDHYALDLTRAKSVLGWKPNHYVGDCLGVMIELLKTDPLEWYRTNGFKAPHWLVKNVEELTHAHAK